MVAELTYFPITGNFNTAVDGALTNFDVVATCTARLPAGFSALITDLDIGGGTGADVALAFPPESFSTTDGVLSGFSLLANDTSVLGPVLAAASITTLYYDVQFSRSSLGYQVPQNFSFVAPTGATTVCLTDPDLERFQFGGVIPTVSLPAGMTAFGVELLGAANQAAAVALLELPTVPAAGIVKSTGTALAPATAGRETPSGTVNGVTTTFTLSHTPFPSTEVLTYNGLEQTAGVDYAISGATITFTTAPLSGVLRCSYWY